MIDLGVLMNFLTGVGISALIFLFVEFIIKVTTVQDNNQKSNLYSIALLSCFSIILYAPFLLNVQIHGDQLVLFFPNILIELEAALKTGFFITRGGSVFFNFRLIFLGLLGVSLLFFVSTLVLSKSYVKRRFHAEQCEDKRLITVLKRVCHNMGVKVPEVLMIEGVNAFVFGVPAVLAVGKELLTNTDEKELELVLKHEMNHIKHHENVLKPFLSSLRILFFFNPVVHVLSRKIAKEREFFADKVFEKRKNKLMFLYTLVRLNELHITKKRLLFSITSSPLVKSNLVMRTETLLSESRRRRIYPYLVSFWVFVLLLVAGAYVSSNFLRPRPIPLSDAVPDDFNRFGEPAGPLYMGDVRAHQKGVLEYVPPAGMRKFVYNPTGAGGPPFDVVAGRMSHSFYGIDVDKVTAVLLVISLSSGLVQYVWSVISKSAVRF